jgi:hypothetical protein
MSPIVAENPITVLREISTIDRRLSGRNGRSALANYPSSNPDPVLSFKGTAFP